jgi:hypothetical protein
MTGGLCFWDIGGTAVAGIRQVTVALSLRFLWVDIAVTKRPYAAFCHRRFVNPVFVQVPGFPCGLSLFCFFWQTARIRRVEVPG